MSFATDWLTSWRGARLRRRFVAAPTVPHLDNLLAFTLGNDQPVPLNVPDVRRSLFGMKSWDVSQKHRELLFFWVEHSLFDAPQDATAAEWQVWLRASRSLGRPVAVINPKTCRAILEALRAEKLTALDREDHDFLLNCFAEGYRSLLTDTTLPKAAALPILLEFVAIGHLLGTGHASLDILTQWFRDGTALPRALASIETSVSAQSPIRGVGSPHGVSVTIYHDAASPTPVRISFAGTTGDATLNSQLFTSLFSAALACDDEPSFVMLNGGSLTLTSTGILPAEESHRLLSAVVGPAGPVEPGPHVPTLGMDAKEALDLVSDLFERFQEVTGLVHVMRWDIADPRKLEERVAASLGRRSGGTTLIRSDRALSEGSGVIHTMPMLHRTKDGSVSPIEIEVPYHVLGANGVFELLNTARTAYMAQLIAAGRKREAMARHAYEAQAKAVRAWQSRSADQKAAYCRDHPSVRITQEYDFELGIIRELETPVDVPREQYEEQDRPQIRDDAQAYAERFEKLCQKLLAINKEGGKADVLTFKLLFDAMIRRAKIPIADRAFQATYEKWVDVASLSTWAAIEAFARDRGLPDGMLADDNVLFNARLNPERRSLVIEPWLTVDLHDFILRIDHAQGIMHVQAAGQTASLAATLVPDPDHGIIDLQTLENTFHAWASNNMVPDPKNEEHDLRNRLLNDPTVDVMVHLEQAKRFLRKGDVRRAKELVAEVRKYDVGAVYFWGAVAEQYEDLAAYPAESLGLKGLDEHARADRLHNGAINTLIQFARPGVIQRATIPLAVNARRYWGQLYAKDPSFVNGLLSDNPDISDLERRSLGMSPEEQERCRAAILALSSLELLGLAVGMKETARTLPIAGTWTKELRRCVAELLAAARALSIRDPRCLPQLEALTKKF